MVQVYLYSLEVHLCEQKYLLLGNNRATHSSVGNLSSLCGVIGEYCPNRYYQGYGVFTINAEQCPFKEILKGACYVNQRRLEQRNKI